MHDAEFVTLAAVTWDFPLVGRTRMLVEAWLGAGQRATFVQVPSLRSGLQRLIAAIRPAGGAPVVRPWPVYPSCWWNATDDRRLRRWARRGAVELRRQLDRRLDWADAVAIVISPVWTPWLAELPFRHVVYDCIDDVEVHVPRPALASPESAC